MWDWLPIGNNFCFSIFKGVWESNEIRKLLEPDRKQSVCKWQFGYSIGKSTENSLPYYCNWKIYSIFNANKKITGLSIGYYKLLTP